MGEKPQQIEIHFSDASVQALHAVFDAWFAGRDQSPPSPPPADPFDIGLVPWSFHDPRQGCDVVAYLDPRNLIRHVPITRATDVPKTWRRVWLESRS